MLFFERSLVFLSWFSLWHRSIYIVPLLRTDSGSVPPTNFGQRTGPIIRLHPTQVISWGMEYAAE